MGQLTAEVVGLKKEREAAERKLQQWMEKEAAGKDEQLKALEKEHAAERARLLADSQRLQDSNSRTAAHSKVREEQLLNELSSLKAGLERAEQVCSLVEVCRVQCHWKM